MTARRALIVEDDPISADALAGLVEHHGFSVTTVPSLAAAATSLPSAATAATAASIPSPPDLLLLDLGLPDGDGLALIEPFAALAPRPAIVVLTGETRLERAVAAMQLGASDYLTKPLAPTRLSLSLARLVRELDARDERDQLLDELRRVGHFHGLVGRSAAMRKVFDEVARAAPSELPIYVVGESGTGKELLANAVHQVSRRRRGPLVAVNCGAIPRQLAESELFGHEAGAFTGAHRQHLGAFERANGGTLFLDELTEMPLELQVLLLRALESRKITRVGGSRELPVDVRVVAASNRDPAQAVRDGRLREDLFFRLHVVPIQLPPLAARGDDVLLLADHLLSTLGPDKRLSADAREAILAHPWPGNVRELKNTLARAAVLTRGELIEPSDLGLSAPIRARPPIGAGSVAALHRPDVVAIPASATLAEAEKILIQHALDRFDNNRTHAAKALGIATKTLYNKLKTDTR